MDKVMLIMVPAEYKGDARRLYQKGIRGNEEKMILLYAQFEAQFKIWLSPHIGASTK